MNLANSMANLEIERSSRPQRINAQDNAFVSRRSVRNGCLAGSVSVHR